MSRTHWTRLSPTSLWGRRGRVRLQVETDDDGRWHATVYRRRISRAWETWRASEAEAKRAATWMARALERRR